MTLDLNEQCSKTGEPSNSIFSKELRASKNYIYTYQQQTQHIGVFLKPVFLVWYHQDQDGLHATLVTPQEVKELEQNINNLSASWIATTGDTLVAGTRPEGMRSDPSYQSLREQVRFFNGEFNSLLNQDSPLTWIKEEPIKKLAFFNEQLMALRPGSASGFRQLQVALTQGKTEGFTYINTRPFEDLTRFNWTTVFPKILPTQAKEYKKLAEAFVYLNKNWHHKIISLDDLQQEFDLPINSLVFIDNHLRHLMSLKEVLAQLQNLNTQQPFLLNLTEEQNLCLEQCIGISISRLRETYHSSLKPANEQAELWLTSINALNILRLYPASKEDSRLFNPYFEACAAQTNFKELLLALLKTDNPSLLLQQNILKNPVADAEVVTELLQQRRDFDPELLLLLAKKCQNDEQIDLLLQQTNCNEELAIKLLKNTQLKESHLIQLFNYVHKESTLALISQHPAAGPKTYAEILQYATLTAKGMLQFLNNRIFSQEELYCARSQTEVFLN